MCSSDLEKGVGQANFTMGWNRVQGFNGEDGITIILKKNFINIKENLFYLEIQELIFGEKILIFFIKKDN